MWSNILALIGYREGWTQFKREYWLCLVVLGVSNIIGGHSGRAAYILGIVAVWATIAEWLRKGRH